MKNGFNMVVHRAWWRLHLLYLLLLLPQPWLHLLHPLLLLPRPWLHLLYLHPLLLLHWARPNLLGVQSPMPTDSAKKTGITTVPKRRGDVMYRSSVGLQMNLIHCAEFSTVTA